MELENILEERGIEYCIPDTVVIIQNYKPLDVKACSP